MRQIIHYLIAFLVVLRIQFTVLTRGATIVCLPGYPWRVNPRNISTRATVYTRTEKKSTEMGSMPGHSIIRGPARALSRPGEPVHLHRIFEHVVGELEKMRNDNNNTGKYETIHNIKLSQEMLQNAALIHNGRVISFPELNSLANQLARAMVVSMYAKKEGDHANPDGDVIVAVCLPPSDVLVITLLACWKIGAAYLPIDPSFPHTRIDHILRESEPGLVIVRRKDRHLFHSRRVIEIETLEELALDLDTENLTDRETVTGKVPQTAIVLYTSGSTGIPKGVRISHSVVLNRLKWQWETFPYSKTEKVGIFKTALTFVDSVSEIWGPLLNARSVLVVPKEESKDAEVIMQLLEKYKVERLVLVPTLLQSILLYLKSHQRKASIDVNKPLRHLRLWVCSGETLAPSLVHEFYKFFDKKNHKLCNFYGSTEVMGDVTFYVVEDTEEVTAAGRVAIGKPTNNSIIYLLDEKLAPVNMGETGEIYVSGMNLALGYVKNRDPDRFIDNNVLVDSEHRKLYRTGDYGKIHKNILYFEGRKDSQIKVRGHRVDLSEIEAALKKVSPVKQSVVLAYNPGQIDQAVLAFVICGMCKRQEVEQQLKQLLPGYMLPQVIVVENIPLLVNGKVDRQFLLSVYRNKAPVTDPASAVDLQGIPTEEQEKAKAIFQTMAEVLGTGSRGRITPESNFFSLGGNSLNAVYFITKLRDLGYAITISDFLGCQTLSEVLQKVSLDNESVKLTDDATTKELQNKYKIEILSEETKQEFIEILSTSFYEKADLESYLDPKVPYNDYVEVIEACWKYILDDGLSFIVRDERGVIIGAAMNKDAYTEMDPNEIPQNRLSIVLDFLDELEHKVLEEKLPKGKGKNLHNFMMGSRNYLTPQETIKLFIFMEEELFKLAKSLKFEGVFTSNTSPLTQQLGTSVNNYETLYEYQANKYIAPDGTKPFEKGPDSLKVIVCWKSTTS